MPTTVRRAIIVGVGGAGRAIVEKFNQYLRERHDSVPVIQTLIIGRADSAAASRDINITWDADDMARLAEQADLSWLPVGAPPLTGVNSGSPLLENTRAGGRLVLFKYVNHVQNAIRARLYDISRAANVGAQRAAPLLTIHHPRSTDFYLVGSLADPLFSGSFVDLAYLLYHLGREGATERDFVFVNGILLLPGFDDDVAPLTPADADAAQEQRVWQDANVYAALRELDYFTNNPHYTCAYRHNALTVTAATRPFHGGACYLLTPFNEHNRSLPRLSDATAMVAEGLYQMLLSPLKGRLEPVGGEARYAGKAGAYASFGVAALTAPMRRVTDYCAWRLCTAWVEDYLLQDAPDDLGAARQFRQELGLTREQRKDFRSLEDFGSLDTPFYRARELEQRLLEAYERYRRYTVPTWQSERQAEHEELLREAGENLTAHARQMLDTDAVGSISRAHNLFAQLRGQFQADYDDLTAEHDTAQRDIAQNDLAFDRALGRYLDAAAAYGAAPFVPLWFTIGLFAALFWYTWSALSTTLRRPALALGLMGVGSAVIFFLLYRAYRRIRQSRAQLLALHAQRAGLLHHAAELASLVDFYHTLVGWSDDLLGELTAFREKLERLAQRSRAELERADWQEVLYGAPDFALAQSVLTREDVEKFYQEIAGRDPAVSLRALLSGTSDIPYHQWQAPEQTVARLLDYLYMQAHTRASAVREQRIEQKLARLSQAELRGRVGRTLESAAPFWQCDTIHLTPPPPAAQRFIALSLSPEEQPDSPLTQVLRELGVADLVGEGYDPYRLLCMTVQRGIPLDAVAVVRRCRVHYEALQRAGREGNLRIRKWANEQMGK